MMPTGKAHRSDRPELTEREVTAGILWFPLWAAGLPLLLRLSAHLSGQSPDSPWLSVIGTVVGAAFTVFLFRRFLISSFRDLRDHAVVCVICTAAGLLLYYTSQFLITAAMHLFIPAFSIPGGTNAVYDAAEYYRLICAVCLAPITEEMLMRALLFGRLEVFRRIPAYALSTTVFAALHFVAYAGKLNIETLALLFVSYIPGGLILALAYSVSENILTAIWLHTLINLIGCFLR